MKCQDLQELISAYVDGELPQTQRDFVEAHLQHCRDCRMTLAEYERISEQMSSLRVTPPLRDIKAGIISKTTTENVTGKPRGWLRPILFAAPFVLALAIIIPMVIPGTPLTPEKILARAGAEGAAIKSYRMGHEYYIYNQDTQEYVLRAQGGFDFSGDRYHEQLEFLIPPSLASEITGAGTSETIGAGEKAYGRVTGNLGYTAGISASGWQQYTPSEILTRKNLAALLNIEGLPDENIDGAACYHFRGAIDISKGNMNSEYEITTAVNEEFWIGKDDYIVRQMKTETIREAIPGNYPGLAEIVKLTGHTLEVWKYSDFNKAITIDLPFDAQGKLLVGWAVLPMWVPPAK